MEVPYGYCKCGCGGNAPIAKKTRNYAGLNHKKGQPIDYINGHARRVKADRRWIEEDRGYKTPCWIWQLSYNKWGYGLQSTFRKGRKSGMQAHKAVYIEYTGLAPKDDLDHLCRVRGCVNPAHLEDVSKAVNSQRGLCAKLTAEDVIAIRKLGTSGVLQKEIATLYGISRSNISVILRGGSWKNLTGL